MAAVVRFFLGRTGQRWLMGSGILFALFMAAVYDGWFRWAELAMAVVLVAAQIRLEQNRRYYDRQLAEVAERLRAAGYDVRLGEPPLDTD